MTDRFDDLLIKARAEMLGKHTLRAEPSTDEVFETVWDNMQKGFFDGVKRGYKGKRRMPGRSGQLNDDQLSMYNQMRGPKPKRTRKPRQPKAPAPPITDQSRMLPEQSANQQSNQPESPREPLGLPAPREKTDPVIDLEEGKDYQLTQPQFEDIGAQGPWGGANSAPENRQLPAPKEDVGAQEPPSAFEQGWNVSQRRDATNTADEWGNVEDMPSAPPEAEAPAEPPAEPSRVGLPWQPTLTESGPGSRAEDWNTRSRKQWGARSNKGKEVADYYASLENDDQGLLEPIPSAEDEMFQAGVEGREKSKGKPQAPAPNAPTDVESATERAKGRQAKRESIPQQQQTLFDAPAPAEPKLEDLPGNPDVKGPLAEAAGGVPYGEYTKHIQNAMQGNEQSLQFFVDNPDAVKQHGSGVLPKRIQESLDAMGGSKKKSHDAFNSAWSVLKDPFANPFDNPSAFATYDDFNLNKNNPRLPKEGAIDGVLSRNPDPPAMNAGMPRDPDLLDRLKIMEQRKKIMEMGPEAVMDALGDTHEGDYRHIFNQDNPNAFRHGIQDAGADEIKQLLNEINRAKMPGPSMSEPSPDDYANTLVADPPYMSNDEKLASADLSLLPAGILKQMKGQQQASADYSLLPQGWQEGVVE
jgi:hypothetical protein